MIEKQNFGIFANSSTGLVGRAENICKKTEKTRSAKLIESSQGEHKVSDIPSLN